jgi:hypothetical protein
MRFINYPILMVAQHPKKNEMSTFNTNKRIPTTTTPPVPRQKRRNAEIAQHAMLNKKYFQSSLEVICPLKTDNKTTEGAKPMSRPQSGELFGGGGTSGGIFSIGAVSHFVLQSAKPE